MLRGLKKRERVQVANFSYVVHQKLAGSGNLGNLRGILTDLLELEREGIVGIVSLTGWLFFVFGGTLT